MSQVPPELAKVYEHIDQNIDQHVVNLQKWIQQPSISNSGEGIPESAEMVKGFFDELGCQQTQVYDPGVTEYGSPSNPVVYAKCDEGAEKTVLIYWMYDTMPVTQPDAWQYPPFEARLVEQAPYKKVLIGRGATNSKGPQMVQLNAFRAIKAVHGKLPVNLVFVAEGDEERMDIGLRKWVKDHPELLEGVDGMIRFGSQGASGGGGFGGGTYTGIEAVSNGLQIMREPRAQTGRRTMAMMAASLALTAGGILVAYLLLVVAMVFEVRGQHVNHAPPGRLFPARGTAQAHGLPGDDGRGVPVDVGVRIHEPRHGLRVGVDIRCWNVTIRTEYVMNVLRELSGDLLKVPLGQHVRVHRHSALGRTKGHVHQRALPRHQRCHRPHFGEVDRRVVTDASLVRATRTVVLHPVTPTQQQLARLTPDR